MTRHQTFGPGAHSLAAEVYAADPAQEPSLSASIAHLLIAASPAHAWEASPSLNPDHEPEEKTAFDIGTAVHAVMTGVGPVIEVIEADDFRSKAAQQARDDAREAGLVPLTRPQAENVWRMVAAAQRQMKAHGIGDPFARGADAGTNEVSLIWQADGVWNRARPDCMDLAASVAYDLKTVSGYADPEAWVRSAMAHGVDLRAAHYLDGLAAIYPGIWRYRFVLLERDRPHCLAVVELSGAAVEIGRKKLRRARSIWRQCLDGNDWPGWSSEIAVVDPPGWHETAWLDRESREADYRQRHGRDILAAALRWQSPQGV
jgi:hypothetical protein